MSIGVKNTNINGKKPRGVGVRFQPGNKFGHGRPRKELCIPDLLRAIGEESVPLVLLAQLQADYGPDFRPRNMREAALRVTYAQYAKGDPAARQFVAERTEGKVSDHLTMEDVTPTKIVFEEVLVGGQVVANTIKRTITRPNDNPS